MGSHFKCTLKGHDGRNRSMVVFKHAHTFFFAMVQLQWFMQNVVHKVTFGQQISRIATDTVMGELSHIAIMLGLGLVGRGCNRLRLIPVSDFATYIANLPASTYNTILTGQLNNLMQSATAEASLDGAGAAPSHKTYLPTVHLQPDIDTDCRLPFTAADKKEQYGLKVGLTINVKACHGWACKMGVITMIGRSATTCHAACRGIFMCQAYQPSGSGS